MTVKVLVVIRMFVLAIIQRVKTVDLKISVQANNCCIFAIHLFIMFMLDHVYCKKHGLLTFFMKP